MDKELLKDVYLLLQSIAAYPKRSIGSIKNTYVPQLSVKKVDNITERVRSALKEFF